MVRARPITGLECFAFMISMIGVQLSSELFAQWGTYFYSPSAETGRTVYVAIGSVGVIFMVGRLFDIYTDSLVGVWSDRAVESPGRLRVVPIHGRRRPFIFWGSLLMTLTGIAFWYPPVNETSALNLVYGTVMMSLHWGMYTLAYIPLLALSLDFARDEKSRIRLGTWIAVGMILGIVFAALLPGELIVRLDPARADLDGDGAAFSAGGYERVAILFSVMSLLCFQFFLVVVKERPYESGESLPARSGLHQLLHVAQLPRSRRYLTIMFLFYIGVLANQRALPYWVELGIGGDESTVTTLGIPFIVTCLLGALSCPFLIRHFALKWLLVLAVGLMGFVLPLMYGVAVIEADLADKLAWAMALYALNGFGLGMMYVLATPLMGELVDAYAMRYGERKEAVFNAMHAIMVKFAQVFSILIATQSMNVFGNSSASPIGVFLVAPLGGLFCLAAFVAALQYPVADAKQMADH